MLEKRTAPLVSVASLHVKNDRPPDKEASAQLAASIREVGLLHPIVIDREHNVVAGRRRLAAVKLLGWSKVPATVVGSPNHLARELGTIDENLVRSDLTTLERAERLARRQELYQLLGKKGFTPDSAKLARVTTRSVQHEVQIAQNISREAKRRIRGTANEDSKRDLLALARMPEADQVRVARVATEKSIPIRQAAHVVKKGDQVRAIKKLQLPKGKFDVVAADFPWEFKDQLDAGRRLDYPTMTVEEGIALDTSWVSDDCVLWFWSPVQCVIPQGAWLHKAAFVPAEAVPDAYRIIGAWGFTVRQLFFWYKGKMGLGHYGRNMVEVCILATRGKPVLAMENVGNYWFATPREHSRKPDEFWETVRIACPGTHRLELFSREARRGWTVFGDEVGKFRDVGADSRAEFRRKHR